MVGSLTDDGRVTGVIVESKAGRAAIRAGVVIDTTGDGDLAAAAGAAFETDRRPLPVTLMSTVAGVDTERALAQLGNWGRLRALVEEAVTAGDLEFDLEVHSKEWAPGVFAAELCYPGQINLWSGSMFGVDGIDPDDLTRAEIVTRQHTMKLVAFLRENLDGFERRVSSGRPPRSACAARGASRALRRPASKRCSLRRSRTPWPSPTCAATCAFRTARWCRATSTACCSPDVACRPRPTPWSSCA